MLHNRKEIITVEKLKTAVQQMMRKDFSLSYLKQIKTVFPAAYRSHQINKIIFMIVPFPVLLYK